MNYIIYNIIIIIVLYIYLHNPILSYTGFGSIKFLYLLLFFLVNPQIRYFIKKQQGISYAFIAIIFFCIIRTLLGGTPSYIYSSFIAYIEVFIIPIIIIYFIKRREINAIQSILYIGAISCIITIISLFSPNFHSTVRGLMIEYEILEKMKFRGYGFSEGLTYAYGIILGMIGGISLPYLNKYKWFIIFIPLLCLSILVNARTGMIIFFGCIGFYLLSNLKTSFKIVGLISIIFIIISNSHISLENIGFEEEYTAIFIEEFFNEMSDTFLGTNKSISSTSETLFKDMIVLPNNLIEWGVGRGYSIFLEQENSDIGFILQLNYGGIIYIMLLINLIYQLIKQVKSKYIKLLLLFTFIVANLKGDFIINSGGFRLFMFIILIYCYKYNHTTPLKMKNNSNLCIYLPPKVK